MSKQFEIFREPYRKKKSSQSKPKNPKKSLKSSEPTLQPAALPEPVTLPEPIAAVQAATCPTAPSPK